jgi:phenylacetaldehyde dehydrogenase
MTLLQGEVLAHVTEGDKADIDLAVQAARKAFEEGPWRKMTSSDRGKVIWKLADLLESNLEEFAQLESLDNGKPLTIARAADVPLAVDLFRYMACWTTKIEGNTIPILFPIAWSRVFGIHSLGTGWGGWSKSFHGISLCSWPPGNWDQH